MPAFQQLHHGSDEAKALAMAYGFNHMGGMTANATSSQGTDQDDTFQGTSGRDAFNGGLGDDIINGMAGKDILQGSYGNDILNGGSGSDVLDGGHGEDILNGGAGNDLLISQSDGREGPVAYDPDRDEGDPDNELTNGKLYPDQPIPRRRRHDRRTWAPTSSTSRPSSTPRPASWRNTHRMTAPSGGMAWPARTTTIHNHWVDVIRQRHHHRLQPRRGATAS